MSFLGLLKKSNLTAAELRNAVTKISVRDLEATVAELEAERRRLLLDGTDDQVAGVEAKITIANRDVERACAAVEEYTARIAEAEARERMAGLERLAAENRGRRAELRRVLLDIHEAAAALAAALVSYRDLDRAWHDTSRVLGDADRHDLIEPSLQDLIGARDGEGAAAQFGHQVAGLANAKLPGYYPREYIGSGSKLALLESIKLPRTGASS
ncbi:hypothetical protein A33M_1900 [Rhodovulum sp. PH10]|uniref:hypothetical protein n=1 Tax=Rhodovulum sp. PH10 TaxID=1187851 RepID=UPI00027C28D4|nr:hypothetical protein [Rhodovulum sp. PH10]EJW12617.1 hypothetical protein A33M_1900 [Rhodovulum sp. PH10]